VPGTEVLVLTMHHSEELARDAQRDPITPRERE
jgi:hypothetical protein